MEKLSQKNFTSTCSATQKTCQTSEIRRRRSTRAFGHWSKTACLWNAGSRLFILVLETTMYPCYCTFSTIEPPIYCLDSEIFWLYSFLVSSSISALPSRIPFEAASWIKSIVQIITTLIWILIFRILSHDPTLTGCGGSNWRVKCLQTLVSSKIVSHRAPELWGRELAEGIARL